MATRGSYFEHIPADVSYLILSKLEFEHLRIVSKSLNIKLSNNIYKQLLIMRDPTLYKDLNKVIKRSYYDYAEDAIYTLFYPDSLSFGPLSMIPLFEYEMFSDVTVNLVRSMVLDLAYNYLFNNLDTIPMYKGAPDVISTVLDTYPDFLGESESKFSRIYFNFLSTGKLDGDLIIDEDVFATLTQNTELHSAITIYILIKVRRPGIYFKRFLESYLQGIDNGIAIGGLYIGENSEYIQLYSNYPEFINSVTEYLFLMKDQIEYID